MRLTSLLLSLPLLASLPALADEPVDIISTAQVGEIEKVKDFLLFSSSQSYPVSVPARVSVGQSFDVRYKKDGETVTERFIVADMAILPSDNRCWLHSRLRTRYDTSPADKIYVKPCSRVR